MSEYIVPTTDKLPVNPKVKIYFRGLAVICFSKENERAEIGYVNTDEEYHDPHIVIKDSDGQIVKNSKGQDINGSMAGKNLSVTVAGKRSTEVFYKDHDARNFNTMLDLSKLYGKADIKDCADYYSKIYVENAVFYSYPKSCNMINLIPYDHDNAEYAYSPLRVTAIGCAAVKSDMVCITYDGEDIPLDPDPDKKYEISIYSACLGSNISDFKYYYDIIENGGNIRYNMKPEVTPTSETAENSDQKTGCLTDFDLKIKKELRDESNFTETGDEAVDKKRAEERAKKEKYLEEIKCYPGPCLLVSFAHKSRSLCSTEKR